MSESGDNTEAEEEDNYDKEGDRDRYTPRRTPVDYVRLGGGASPPPEENTDLPDFSPERAHLLLRGFYGYFLDHNDVLHLDRGVTEDTIWKRH